MFGHLSPFIRIMQGIDVKGRIGNDQIKLQVGFPMENIRMDTMQSICKWRRLEIQCCPFCGRSIQFHGPYLRLREPLRQHQGNHAGPGTNVQYALGCRSGSRSPQQDPIRIDTHRTMLLVH